MRRWKGARAGAGPCGAGRDRGGRGRWELRSSAPTAEPGLGGGQMDVSRPGNPTALGVFGLNTNNVVAKREAKKSPALRWYGALRSRQQGGTSGC